MYKTEDLRRGRSAEFAPQEWPEPLSGGAASRRSICPLARLARGSVGSRGTWGAATNQREE